MKIHLDMQGAQTASRHRGIGRYCASLTREFLALAAPTHDVTLLFNGALDGIDETITSLGKEALRITRRVVGPIRHTAEANPANDYRRRAAEQVLSYALGRGSPTVVWLSSVFEGFGDDALVPQPAPRALTVATLYDLIPLHDPSYLGSSRAKEWYAGRLEVLRRCDLLLAISDWARVDAIEQLGLDPDRVVAIGAGVQEHFAPSGPSEQRSSLLTRHRIDRPFVLYSGGFDKRKNVPALIRAFGALPRQILDAHQLVIVGRPDEMQSRQLHAVLKDSGLSAQSVVFTGYVSDGELVTLYSACKLFVFPSELEGFGLTPLEAMACGAAVIVNNAASLPEVVGDPDALFDASSDRSIAAKMQEFLCTPHLLEQARIRGLARSRRFSWRAVAECALRAMETLQRSQIDSSAFTQVLSSGPVITNESQARVQAPGASVPQYRLDASNVASLSSWVRKWPGRVFWSGQVPANGPTPPEERYRLGGYTALAQPAKGEDWLRLIEAYVPGVLVPEDPTIQPEGKHPSVVEDLARQRTLETCIANELASKLGEDDLARVADAIARLRPTAPVRWLVDVTSIAQNDLGTGVQRVTRSILTQWLARPPEGIRIEPVVFRDGRYRHAHAYACHLLGLPFQDLPGDLIAATENDLFVGLDWAMDSVPASEPLLKAWRRAGVRMHFVVHDLLPMTLPEAFHPSVRSRFERWLGSITRLADGLHCVSRQTAGDIDTWLYDHGSQNQFGYAPSTDVFRLGVEASEQVAMGELPVPLRQAVARRPTLLMVGTIEPRKGHEQALDAFELLWSSGTDVNLLIIGHNGWLTQQLTRRISHHAEKERRLFWLDNADDAVLEMAYASADALLAASIGEGFGLPLVEASHRGVPVIARALPVFREIMGDYPSYFESETPEELAQHLIQWLNQRPEPGSPPQWPTWEESARSLRDSILEVGIRARTL